MSHFADGRWNPFTGLVAAASGAPALTGVTATVNGVANVETQSATGVDAGTPALFTNSATPVVLLNAFVVPRAGMYLLEFYLKTAAAGTGAGQTCALQVSYNDGTARTTQSVAGFPLGSATAALTLDALTLNAILQGGSVLFCAAASTISIQLLGAGTITTPASVQAYWAIEAV